MALPISFLARRSLSSNLLFMQLKVRLYYLNAIVYLSPADCYVHLTPFSPYFLLVLAGTRHPL